MSNIYSRLRDLAKSVRIQNLFASSKEVHGIHLFVNSTDFSKIQELYLSLLYMYDAINKDLVTEKISKKVFDCELYEDCYMLWKRSDRKLDKKENSKKAIKLVSGKTIKFPKGDKNGRS